MFGKANRLTWSNPVQLVEVLDGVQGVRKDSKL
jgi:hypothetical protein